jgi:ribosomal protein L11 methyltransferase
MQRAALALRADAAEAVIDVLLDLLPHGIREREDGDAVEVVIYDSPLTIAQLETIAGPALLAPIAVEDVPGGWRERRARESRPLEIAGRIHLRRPWDAPPASGLLDVVIERGRGFGTGSHPTTAMVLELLCDTEPQGPLVDLGCGSGVLSIAAAKLGWNPVVGLDYDMAAVEEARANVAENGVEATIEGADLRIDAIPEAAVALANVNPLAIHALIAPRIPASVGMLVASGLVGGEVAGALELYAGVGLIERRRLERHGWAAIELRRAR